MKSSSIFTLGLSLVLALCSTAAFAGGDNGNNGGGNQCQGNSCGGNVGGVIGGGYAYDLGNYSGQATGTFNVGTNGGSMAQTGIYQNGTSFQFSSNSGSAFAGGLADFSTAGFVGATFGGSTSTAYSTGYVNGDAGDYINSTAGGVGSNYEANVTGNWHAVEFTGFGGFIAGAFGSW